MAYKKLFKELFEQYTAKYKRKPKGLELIKIKLKAADLQREADKLIEFPRDKIKKFFDPDDPLPYYNETPGEFARRETPGSIENLRQEMKIAYRNEFDRLTGNETAEELTEMLKNLDIDGVPFAGGGVVKKIIKSLTMKNKDPMDSMKELNEVLKKRKELDLTDDQVDEIMEAGNEWIFQKDPDNLFIPGDSTSKSIIPKDEYQSYKNDFDKEILGKTDNYSINDEIKQGVDDVLSDTSPAGLAKSIEIDNLMLEYPGMTKDLADQIASSSPTMKADMIAMVKQTFELDRQGKSGDEIIEIFKNTTRTKQAGGGLTRTSVAGGGLLKKVLKDYQKYLKTRKERPSKKRFKEIPFRKFFEIYGPENFADGGQATSTGLNYLLGEDDTNSRVPYAAGGRRGFLKLLAGLGTAGVAFKTGLLGLTKSGGKKAATEVAEQVVKSEAPPHFFKLVAKIKALGDDAPKLAVKDREVVTTYKDYTLTEDITTGEQTIQRMKIDDDLKYDASEYYGKPVGEEVYMSYRPGKGQIDETTKGRTPIDEYTEDTSLIRSDRPAEGEVMETVSGVPDDIFEEVGETIPEVIRKGKSGGGIMKIIKKLVKPKKKKLETVKDFVDRREFLKKSVGNSEKNKNKRMMDDIKRAVEDARKNPGFKFKDIDIEKEIEPILNKGRKLHAGGGIATKLIRKLNAISPGSTKRGKLSKPMSKKAKDKKQLREAIENFSKRNRAR